MPRPRPAIPLPVQVLVAERQLFAKGNGWQAVIVTTQFVTLGRRLSVLLWLLFGTDQTHLDHDPPLRWRTYNERIKNIAARYTPNANSPDHLVWLTVEAHKIKTNKRGNGAQYPDRVLINRERARERPEKPKRSQWPTAKKAWPSRPFPKGRGFQSRRI